MLSLWQMLKIMCARRPPGKKRRAVISAARRRLLLSNAMAILNRPRFLSKFECAPGDMSVKGQVLNFLLAAQRDAASLLCAKRRRRPARRRYMRPILIPCNVICIFVEVLFGS
jgi:hypothetical protein